MLLDLEKSIYLHTHTHTHTRNVKCPLISNCIWLKATKWKCEEVRKQKKTSTESQNAELAMLSIFASKKKKKKIKTGQK